MPDPDQLRKLQDELRQLDMNIVAAQKRRALVAAEIRQLTGKGEVSDGAPKARSK